MRVEPLILLVIMHIFNGTISQHQSEMNRGKHNAHFRRQRRVPERPWLGLRVHRSVQGQGLQQYDGASLNRAAVAQGPVVACIILRPDRNHKDDLDEEHQQEADVELPEMVKHVLLLDGDLILVLDCFLELPAGDELRRGEESHGLQDQKQDVVENVADQKHRPRVNRRRIIGYLVHQDLVLSYAVLTGLFKHGAAVHEAVDGTGERQTHQADQKRGGNALKPGDVVDDVLVAAESHEPEHQGNITAHKRNTVQHDTGRSAYVAEKAAGRRGK